MKTATLKTIEQSEKVGLYSICFDGNDLSEYEKFVQKFLNDATLNSDFQKVFRAINRIVANGALERYFRPEGKLKDHLAALSIDSKVLRLYCLRISNQILIVGNGGAKTTRTYEEDVELSGYVIDLQKFDKLLAQELASGKIRIEQNVITGIESASFEL
ncbi:MAG: hypothetical protein J5741_08105 [Bacteroidales bacterium]|nr:hypothetical protein [Bacteroidales bacterium]